MQVIHTEGTLLSRQSIKHLAGVGHLLLAQTVAQSHMRHIGEGCRTRAEHLNQLLVDPLEFSLARFQVQIVHLGDRPEGLHRPPASL